jgi:hypothetical protein
MIRRVGIQSDGPARSLYIERNAPNGLPSGAFMDLPVGVTNFHSIDGKNFEQIVLTVLLREEKPRPR